MTGDDRISIGQVILKCHPRRLRIVVGILAVLVVCGAVLGWMSLPGHVRAQFSLPQLMTLIAMLFVLVGGIGLVASSYVEAGTYGLVVRNGLRTRRFDWMHVVWVSYRSGDPWASVWLLPDVARTAGSPGAISPSARAAGDHAATSGYPAVPSGVRGPDRSPVGSGQDEPGPADQDAADTAVEHLEPVRVIMLGIQRSDRERAQQAVAELRRLHAIRSRGT